MLQCLGKPLVYHKKVPLPILSDARIILLVNLHMWLLLNALISHDMFYPLLSKYASFSEVNKSYNHNSSQVSIHLIWFTLCNFPSLLGYFRAPQFYLTSGKFSEFLSLPH
jgi:hypothetical protein